MSRPISASGDNFASDNAASPKAMRLQGFGLGARSFATLPQAPALYISIMDGYRRVLNPTS